MATRVTSNKQVTVWATLVLTAAYALFFAASIHGSIADTFIWEGLFAGPMVIGCFLSIALSRAKSRIVLLGFAIVYSILSALIFYWTFGAERDAQYQLTLLLIPALGFPLVCVFGIVAAMSR